MLGFEQENLAAREKQRDAALEHASLYGVFLSDSRAQQLLVLWQAAAKRVIPVDASLQQYVAATKMREWVQTIEDNIELAKRPADFLTT